MVYSPIKELQWRGMVHDIIEGTDEQLTKEQTTVYLGIDPTADSLHVGHLVSILLMKHLQKAGHKPILVVGGATGMIGDPSGKSEERNLLDYETLRHNEKCIAEQLKLFFDFSENIPNKAIILNNYDWIKNFDFISFLRDIGKHITVNYMMAKDSVKKRLESGISFTEFSYQLLQAYDFLYLYQNYNCKMQIGGSDQWGNITTGIELIRRKTGSTDVFAFTCPLLTKPDGTKFGKTEKGNIWLSKKYTSSYKFYQFWINISDEEAEKYIKIFSFLTPEQINELIEQHKQSPHLRILQNQLAKELTILVHGETEYEKSLNASKILFGEATTEMIKTIDEATLLELFEGVPKFSISKTILENNTNPVDLLAVHTSILPSKTEARKLIQSNGISINKEKVSLNTCINRNFLINDKYIIVQKGKKNYYLIIVEN